MSGFNKIVPEIIQSSIWNEPSDIRIVWITMIAVKDEEGYVRGDDATIARLANVPLAVASEALRKFQEPDLASGTPDHEGRRIAKAPGGWAVLNHHLYRTGDRNAYMRDYMQKYRNPKKKRVNSVNINRRLHSASVSASEAASASEFLPKGMQGENVLSVWREWVAYRITRAKVKDPVAMFKRQAEMLNQWGPDGAIASMRQSMANGWQGLFEPKTNSRPSPSDHRAEKRAREYPEDNVVKLIKC